jgi:shikimate kinase
LTADGYGTRYGYVTHEGCDHIFFVGFLGAGKSTLARNLGRLYHRTYVDTDRMAERLLCKTVTECFEQDGEEAFRDAETEVLKRLRDRKSLLVSCGGGIVERAQNTELLHEMGKVVFLDGDLADSLRQIQHPEKRPDLSLEDAGALYERRRPLFVSSADYVIDIRDKSFEEVADAAGCLLWEEGLL